MTDELRARFLVFPPLQAKDLLHLWQWALSALTLTKWNHTSEHLILDTIFTKPSENFILDKEYQKNHEIWSDKMWEIDL